MSNRLIKLPGPPSASTYGNEGDFYFDTVNEVTYVCKGYRTERIDHGFIDTLVYQSPDKVQYIWEQYGGGVKPEELSDIVKENFPGGVGYEELTETTIFDGTITNDTELSKTNFIEIGKEYTVIWDGATYNCTAFAYEEWDGAAMFGSPYGDYSEYPFCIYEDLEIYIACADDKEHTLSISTLSKVAHKIDAKFLPETIARVEYLTNIVGDINEILDSINGEVI